MKEHKYGTCERTGCRHNAQIEMCIKHLEAEGKEVAEQIFKTIHDKLDKLNGERGNLCLYCESKKYDGQGIIHNKDCIILWLRQKQKEVLLNENTKI